MKHHALLLGAAIGLLIPAASRAWNDTGHKVVARIAWDNMTSAARAQAISLLKAAPSDAGLRSLFPNDSRPLAIREREFFVVASTWSDIIRSRPKYHRRDWHFINYFWEQTSTGVKERPDLKPGAENVTERLALFELSIADATRTKSQRAIDLAWTLHLVGDVHQPLHCSARVTKSPGEAKGDQGGNLFKLHGTNSLHSYWDAILTRMYDVQPGESDDAYIGRLARVITTRYPMSSMSAKMKPGDFEGWAKEGHETCKAVVYPSSLKRGVVPTKSYRMMTYSTGEPAVALAGYRLADMLNRSLGG